MHDDVQRMMHEAEAARRDVARLFAEMARRHCTGAAADGTVTARVDGRGRVLAVDFRPAALRLSTQDLSARVMEALAAAQDEALGGQQDFLARRWVPRPRR